MEIDNTTLNLILDKIDALEKSMSDKIDTLKELFDQKIEHIEKGNNQIHEIIKTHEDRLDCHDEELERLKNLTADKIKKIVCEILKFLGFALLAFIFYKAFPNVAEVIK